MKIEMGHVINARTQDYVDGTYIVLSVAQNGVFGSVYVHIDIDEYLIRDHMHMIVSAFRTHRSIIERENVPQQL